MRYVRIAGHVFQGNAQVLEYTTRRVIGTIIPKDTPIDVLADLQNADLLEELDDNYNLLASHRLVEWLGFERAYDQNHNGDHLLAVTWTTITLDQYNTVNNKIEALQHENDALKARNADLVNAILELGSIISNMAGVSHD